MRIKVAGIGLMLVVVLALAGCGSSSSGGSGGSSSGPIKLGSPTAMTGADAQVGLTWEKGQNAAVAYINAHGGILGRKVEIDRADTQSNPSQATNVTNQMIQSKQYAALIPADGGVDSGPIYEAVSRAKFLALGGAALPNLADPKVYPTAFESSFSPTELGKAAACMVPALGFKSVAIIGLNDSFSQTEVKQWVAKFKQLGIKVTGNQEMGYSDTSATPQLQKLQEGHPQAVLAVLYGPSVGVAFSGMKSLGWDPPFIGDLSVATFPLSAVAKSADYPSKVYGLGTPATTRLASGYNPRQKTAISYLKSAAHVTTFQAAMNTYAYGYDAVMLYKTGAELAKSTNQSAVIKALEGLQAHPSPTGALNENEPPISSSYHGLLHGQMYLLNMKSPFTDGTFAAIKPIPDC
jgi:branched-chain amino acid transport system substrate-binding protein